jgi:VIT1/CCC1 family predicted Fe2+/Mn2+ transporter
MAVTRTSNAIHIGEHGSHIVIGMSDGLIVPVALAAGLSAAVESTSIADRSRGRPRRVRGLWNCAPFPDEPYQFSGDRRHEYACLGQAWLMHCLGIETAGVLEPGGCPRTPRKLREAWFQRRGVMLYTIAVILLILWLLGFVSGYTIGAFIHVLLVVAIVLFLVGLLSGRRVV